MIGRCRTCQASKNTEMGEGLPSGPRLGTLGTIARCLAPSLDLKTNGRSFDAAAAAAAAQAPKGSLAAPVQLQKRYPVSPQSGPSLRLSLRLWHCSRPRLERSVRLVAAAVPD